MYHLTQAKVGGDTLTGGAGAETRREVTDWVHVHVQETSLLPLSFSFSTWQLPFLGLFFLCSPSVPKWSFALAFRKDGSCVRSFELITK